MHGLERIKMEPIVHRITGRDDLAQVYLLQLDEDPQHLVETVDSIDPRYSRQQKSVIIVSTQFGCPVGCLMCDAGVQYFGNLSAEQILAQVQFVSGKRPENLGSQKLKVHFARMGEPALNPAVLEAARLLPERLPAQGLILCISTVAPQGSAPFFEELLQIKEKYYPRRGSFQLQFSINTTDARLRRQLIPIPQLTLPEMARLARPFHRPGDRKVVLNYALGQEFIVDVDYLRTTFDPEHFMIKLTPINPTENAQLHGLETVLSADAPSSSDALVQKLQLAGFDAVVSIGEKDEIEIGSNCGQLVLQKQRPFGELRSDYSNRFSSIRASRGPDAK
jgi:23S rRNA (adenine2503-C2)-methyltransferase